jgi:hypothetical protein
LERIGSAVGDKRWLCKLNRLRMNVNKFRALYLPLKILKQIFMFKRTEFRVLSKLYLDFFQNFGVERAFQMNFMSKLLAVMLTALSKLDCFLLTSDSDLLE